MRSYSVRMSTSKILRRPEVERQTKLSKVTLYRLMHAGAFAKPIKLGERAVGWYLDEVNKWIASRERASFGREA